MIHTEHFKIESESYILTFGKYRGNTLGEVIRKNISYANWLVNLGNVDCPDEIKQMISTGLVEIENKKKGNSI